MDTLPYFGGIQMSMFATMAISKAIKRKEEARKKAEESGKNAESVTSEPVKNEEKTESVKEQKAPEKAEPVKTAEQKEAAKADSNNKGGKKLRDE